MEQKNILDAVINGLIFTPTKDMLVKPLEDEYIEKEITKPVDTGKKDENGFEITDTETVTEKVLTTFKKGIVLRLPEGYEWPSEGEHPEVGDVVVFGRKYGIDFDLFKNSQLVNPYNVVAFVKAEKYFKTKRSLD